MDGASRPTFRVVDISKKQTTTRLVYCAPSKSFSGSSIIQDSLKADDVTTSEDILSYSLEDAFEFDADPDRFGAGPVMM